MILDEADRSVTNNNGRCRDYDGNWLKDDDENRRCYGDREKKFYTSAQWKGEGFYRLVEPAGTQIPEYAPGRYHCGTISIGWLNVAHPIIYDLNYLNLTKSRLSNQKSGMVPEVTLIQNS